MARRRLPCYSSRGERGRVMARHQHRAGKWRRVSPGHPCPICERPDWCSVSADGRLVACRRIEHNGTAKTDKDGAAYYLHRLNGATAPAAAFPPFAAVESGPVLADADTLHTV